VLLCVLRGFRGFVECSERLSGCCRVLRGCRVLLCVLRGCQGIFMSSERLLGVVMF